MRTQLVATLMVLVIAAPMAAARGHIGGDPHPTDPEVFEVTLIPPDTIFAGDTALFHIDESSNGHHYEYLEVYIEWGDTQQEWLTLYLGSPPAPIPHMYNHPGSYTISLWAGYEEFEIESYSEIQVEVVAPNTAPVISAPTLLQGEVGDIVSLVAEVDDSPTDHQFVTVDWGDGSQVTVSGLAYAGFPLSHAYQEPGEFTYRIFSTDSWNAISNIVVGVAVIEDPLDTVEEVEAALAGLKAQYKADKAALQGMKHNASKAKDHLLKDSLEGDLVELRERYHVDRDELKQLRKDLRKA